MTGYTKCRQAYAGKTVRLCAGCPVQDEKMRPACSGSGLRYPHMPEKLNIHYVHCGGAGQGLENTRAVRLSHGPVEDAIVSKLSSVSTVSVDTGQWRTR